MTDENTSDPSPDPGRPIILGGPAAPGAPSPTPHEAAGPDPDRTPEPEPEPIGPRSAVPERDPVSSPTPAPQKRSIVMPLPGVLGFLILAAAIGFLWVRPAPTPSMPAIPPDESNAVAALQGDVASLKTRLAALDSRESSDVAALHAAIASLPTAAPAPAPATAASAPAAQNAAPTQSPAPPSSAPAVAQAAPDTALAETVASLSDRLGQLQSAQAAQAQRTQSLPSADDVSKVASRVDDISQRESKDDNAIRQDLDLVQQQLATLSGQAQTLSKSSAALPRLTAQADRLSQIVRAQEALRAGLPLGTIANAPPALTRFADTAPPTEAALNLSFATAAQAADKAGEPTPDQGHFWHRVWLRVQNLVMVRQGDRVVLGDPTSAVLAHAQTVLNAGDLSGALAVLGSLTGPAAEAMAPWEAQARSLLQAREALTQMAAG